MLSHPRNGDDNRLGELLKMPQTKQFDHEIEKKWLSFLYLAHQVL
jgi:hypothetical protein